MPATKTPLREHDTPTGRDRKQYSTTKYFLILFLSPEHKIRSLKNAAITKTASREFANTHKT